MFRVGIVFGLGLACFGGGCGSRTVQPELEHSGDLTVFSRVSLDIRLGEFVDRDHGARTEAEPMPPIRQQRVLEVRAAGDDPHRVAGLRVFADGVEVDEIGSAAWPQQFSYQLYGDGRWPSPVLLELRYQGARTQALLPPLVVELTGPTGAEVALGEPFVVTWEAPPGPEVSFSARRYAGMTTSACAVRFEPVSEPGRNRATFRGLRQKPGVDPPCTVDVEATWASHDVPANLVAATATFASVTFTRTVSRARRFTVR